MQALGPIIQTSGSKFSGGDLSPVYYYQGNESKHEKKEKSRNESTTPKELSHQRMVTFERFRRARVLYLTLDVILSRS